LAKQQLENLSCLSVSHFAFGRADYDFNGGLVFGRGHGATAIYWWRQVNQSQFIDGETSFAFSNASSVL